MKKKIFGSVIILILIVISYFVITDFYSNKWVVKLQSNYEIHKLNINEVYLGINIENKFTTDKVGVKKYIESFKYSDNYIVLKCLEKNDTISVLYYIVNTDNKTIYGPYDTDSKYEAVYDSVVGSEEVFSIWYKTSGNKPNIEV